MITIAVWLVAASTAALFGLLAHLSSWIVEPDIEIPDYVHEMFRTHDIRKDLP